MDENIKGIKTTSDSISSSVSSLGTINSNVSSVKNTVSSMSSTLSTVNTNVKNLMNSGNGVVKSVQRGTTNRIGTVTISAININKSILLINGDGITSSSYYSGGVAHSTSGYVYAYIESSTKLNISGYVKDSFYLSWQIIEFY